MQSLKYGIIVLAFILCFSFIDGCNRGGSSAQGSSLDLSNPETLGDKIGTSYIEMMTELNTILKAKPEIEELKTQIAELKEKYIAIFFDYGKYREEMTDDNQALVDDATVSKFMEFMELDRTMYDYYTTAVSEYQELDYDLGSELASFNTLSQYAFYELLKKQLPDEAKRLGLQ